MRIEYIAPLSRGISRMKRDLFSPFDLKKWFVVGFTAFLAGLSDFGSSGMPGTSFRQRSKISLGDVLRLPERAWEWLANHPNWAIAIGFGVFLAFVIGAILTWLSSRGKFMFLDNVVRGECGIREPWHAYRDEGNSFFLLSFSLGIIVLAIVIAYLFYCYVNLHALYESGENGRELFLSAILAGIGFLAITLVSGFAMVLLRDFVVPVMYKDRIPALDAVQKFAELLSSHFLYFFGYGLILLCLFLGIAIIIVLIGCGTCCVGFMILAIPYLSSVLLLPISYALRAFSVEFLEQFGPGYDIFPKPDTGVSGGHTLSV